MGATRTPARQADTTSEAAEGGRSPWLEAGPNGEGLQVFDFPTYMLGRLSGLVRRSLIPRYVEPHGLSIPEWRLLAFLVGSEPSSFNEICINLTMDRGHVSRTLPVLQKRGLIKRNVILRKGPLRRGESERQIRFAATARGRALYRQALPLAQRHQMVLLSALDRDERAAFHSIMEKLTRATVRFEQEHAPVAPAGAATGNGKVHSVKSRRARNPGRVKDRTLAAASRDYEELLTGGPT